MNKEMRDGLIFTAGLTVGIIIMMFMMTILMAQIVISSTEVLTLVSEMGVDYIQLAKECENSYDIQTCYYEPTKVCVNDVCRSLMIGDIGHAIKVENETMVFYSISNYNDTIDIDVNCIPIDMEGFNEETIVWETE